MLEALDRANLFVVPLDDSRRWYRYHHLFADVLRTHLLDERARRGRRPAPPRQPVVRRRTGSRRRRSATPWPPGTSSAQRTWSSWPSRRCGGTGRRPRSVAGWTPSPTRWSGSGRCSPSASIGALMAGGEFEGVEDGCGTPSGGWSRRADREGPGARGDGRRRRGGASPASRGRSRCTGPRWRWSRGDVPATHPARPAGDRPGGRRRPPHPGRCLGPVRARVLGRRRPRGRASRRTPPASTGCGGPGTSPTSWGARSRWRTSASPKAAWATRCAPTSRRCSSPPAEAGTVLRGTADMYVGMSQIACERGDLRRPPPQHLLRSQELGEHTGLPQNPYRWRVAMARVREAQGDLAGALDLLDEAQRVYMGDFSPNVRPVPALRARVLAAQGRVGEALGWAREQGLSVDDDLSYLREFEHITLARVLLAQYAADAHGASARRGGPAAGAPAGGRGSGGADRKRHRDPGAAGARPPRPRRHPRCARPAGACADPGRTGGLRPGVRGRGTADGRPADSGRETAGRRGTTFADSWPPAADAGGTAPVKPPAASRRSQGLVEPLSERELEVLRLLATDLDGPAIARRARGVPEHPAHPHQEHLRQARRQQPTRSGASGRGAQPAVAHPRPLTPDLPLRCPPRSSLTRRPLRRCPRSADVTTSITTRGDVRSPHRLLPCGHPEVRQAGGDPAGQHSKRSTMSDTSAGHPTSPGGTRSASRGTSTPAGPPGSTG